MDTSCIFPFCLLLELQCFQIILLSSFFSNWEYEESIAPYSDWIVNECWIDDHNNRKKKCGPRKIIFKSCSVLLSLLECHILMLQAHFTSAVKYTSGCNNRRIQWQGRFDVHQTTCLLGILYSSEKEIPQGISLCYWRICFMKEICCIAFLNICNSLYCINEGHYKPRKTSSLCIYCY